MQLPDKAGRVKVKWNACLSASHVYHNEALIASNDTFGLAELTKALVASVATDRYFKVRNNSLVSLIALIDAGGRAALGQSLFASVLVPLAEACLSFNQKANIPFSEVHRHCLCIYLLHYILLRLVNLFGPGDLLHLSPGGAAVPLLVAVFTDQLPAIWTHLRSLNRSFNKQALLSHTLMLKPSVSATSREVDCLLVDLRTNLDVHWPVDAANGAAVELLETLYRLVSEARVVDSEARVDGADYQLVCDPGSDEDGLLTKRSGASLIFSQIYD